MTFLEQYLAWTPVIIAVIGTFAWVVGLEWRVRSMTEMVNLRVTTLTGRMQQLEAKIDDLTRLLIRNAHKTDD